jgi:hypothetical protein
MKGLCNGWPMAGKPLQPLAICIQYCLIGRGSFRFHPAKQRRPEIETDPRIVIDHLFDFTLPVENPRVRIRGVTLGGNSLIPVMKRTGTLLLIYDAGPGILTGRLVKMAMDTKTSFTVLILPDCRQQT